MCGWMGGGCFEGACVDRTEGEGQSEICNALLT